MARRPKSKPKRAEVDPDTEETLRLDASRWSGFRDGVGEREDGVDEQGFSIELLRLRKEFNPFELPLSDRILRLIDFDRLSATRALRVDHDEHAPRLVLVSERAPGFRLSELLNRGAERGVMADLGAALFVMRRLLATAASLHHQTGVTHFAVAPERIVVTPRGDAVIVEGALAGAIEAFEKMPPAVRKAVRLARATADVERNGPRVDVARIALVGMALVLGRTLDPAEDVDPQSPIVQEVADVAALRAGHQFSAVLTPWFDRAITIDPELSFAGFAEAFAALEPIVPPSDARCSVSRAPVRRFLQDLSVDESVQVHMEALEEDRIRELRSRDVLRRAPAAIAPQEPPVFDDFSIIEDPAAAIIDIPVVVEDLAAEIINQPVANEEPATAVEELLPNGPSVEEPVALVEPVAIEEPVTLEDPVALQETVAFEESVSLQEEPVEEPVAADIPIPIEWPVDFEEPVAEVEAGEVEEQVTEIAEQPIAIEEPVAEVVDEPVAEVLEEPLAIKEPVAEVAYEPIVIDEPIADVVEEPIAEIIEEAVGIEEPVTELIEAPVVETPDEPIASEEPPVEEPPVGKEPPVEEPPESKEPPVEEPPVEPPPREEPPVEEPPVQQPPVEEPAFAPATLRRAEPGVAAPVENEGVQAWIRAAIEQVARAREERPIAPPPPAPEPRAPVFELPEVLPEKEPEPATTTLSDLARELGLTIDRSLEAQPEPVERVWTPPAFDESADVRLAPQDDEAPTWETGIHQPPREDPVPPPPSPEPVAPLPAPPPPIPAVAPAAAATAPRAAPKRKPIAVRIPRVGEALGRFFRIAATLVLLGSVVGAAVYGGRRYYATITAPGTLVVESTPNGADVVIDGAARGVTPLSLELPPGSHVVELGRRGLTRRFTVEVRPGEQTAHTLDWSTVRATGSLAVTSNPSGATVLVDGRERGVTPITIPDLPAGRRTVVIQSSAGTIRRTVTIAADQTATLDESIFSGWIAVFAPVELLIYEANRLIGTTETNRIMVPPGRHAIELVNKELGFRITRSVDVEPGQTTAVNITDVPAKPPD